MALSELSSRSAVETAMDEYDRLGRGPFLEKYKSKGPYRYYIVRRGRRYESKPITAAAHGFEFGRPLETTSFSGGAATVARKLNELGFEVGGPTSGPKEITDLKPGQSYSWSELGTLFDFKPEYFAIAGGMIPRPDDGGAVDLWANRPDGRDRVIFEAKTVRREVEVKRVRAAVAQLLEYRYFYGGPSDTLCLAVDRPLSDVRCRLLDSLGVAVLWWDGQRFCAGSRTAAELLEA